MRSFTHTRLRAALAIAGLGACSIAHALDISGSSTVQPVVEKLVPLYAKRGGEAVTLAGGGSGAGVKNAIAGTSQIGMVSRDLKDDEKAALKNAVIGIDALAIIVNKGNPVSSLSKAQLVDLYSGKIDNWQALGGPDLAVQRVSKEVGRSTLELFEHYTGLLSPDRKKGDKPLISSKAYIVGANVEALTLVGGIPGAIGYVSVGTAHALAEAGMPVKIIPLDGQQPTDEAIKAGSYPIVRPLNLVYTNATPPVQAFLDLAAGQQGQDIVKSLGFLPVGATR
ncbi:phosphate ABC transporter substrate-binding protein [Aromatoleum toluclasticum]|uniref:phosphate ABC transporter substrate-binding protein n=1 Tax=Aromatoleum toluclasticum TaxID=92003 RepID=UPI000379D78D|nr:phosphate ABC transporter substrate-binding protein [Aromatoleum toluclasticum]